MKVKWSEFKSFIELNGLFFKEVIKGDDYILSAFDSYDSRTCILSISDTENEDTIDYETNYQLHKNKLMESRDDTGRPLTVTSNIHVDDGKRVRHKGIVDAIIPSGQAMDLEWKVEQLLYQGQPAQMIMTGVSFKLDGGNHGDTVNFSVVDKDNVLGYGAGYILDQFADNYYVNPNESSLIKEHGAKLITDLYIICHYKNTGVNDARFICNLLRYLVTV